MAVERGQLEVGQDEVERVALEGGDERFAGIDADDLPVEPGLLEPQAHQVRIRGFVFDMKEARRARHDSTLPPEGSADGLNGSL